MTLFTVDLCCKIISSENRLFLTATPCSHIKGPTPDRQETDLIPQLHRQTDSEPTFFLFCHRGNVMFRSICRRFGTSMTRVIQTSYLEWPRFGVGVESVWSRCWVSLESWLSYGGMWRNPVGSQRSRNLHLHNEGEPRSPVLPTELSLGSMLIFMNYRVFAPCWFEFSTPFTV